MTILSFSMLSPLAGAPVAGRRTWSRERSGRAWKTGSIDAWDRTVKFYDNLKFVYQIQTTLREWQQQDEEQRPVKTAEFQAEDGRS